MGLSANKINDLRKIVLFVLKAYLKYWLQTTNAIKSSNNDLKMLKDINSLMEVMPQVTQAALAKIRRHLWYLSEKMVALAFFDKEVSIDSKIAMVRELNSTKFQNDVNRPAISTTMNCCNLSLSNFVSKRTKMFFQILEISTDFLKIHPYRWEDNASYLNARATVEKLTVVNDAAERSISLYQGSKDKAKSNQQKKYLLQVVENERKKYGKLRKSDIFQALSA